MWRWCIVSKRLNSLSWFLVWGLPRRKSALYEMGFWIRSWKGRPPRRCVVGLTQMFGCHCATVVRPSSRWALVGFRARAVWSIWHSRDYLLLWVTAVKPVISIISTTRLFILVGDFYLFDYHDYKVVWTFGRQTTWATDAWATHRLRTQGLLMWWARW